MTQALYFKSSEPFDNTMCGKNLKLNYYLLKILFDSYGHCFLLIYSKEQLRKYAINK